MTRTEHATRLFHQGKTRDEMIKLADISKNWANCIIARETKRVIALKENKEKPIESCSKCGRPVHMPCFACSKSKKDQILQLHKQGMSLREIAWTVKTARSHVCKTIQEEKSKLSKPKKETRQRCPKCGNFVCLSSHICRIKPPITRCESHLLTPLKLKGDHLRRYLEIRASRS